MVRLNKFLAERMGVSRREADLMIEQGEVFVDGKVARVGQQVGPENEVTYNGNKVAMDNEYVYLLFHKPVGYVCSRKRQGEVPTLYELLPEKYRALKTVGRLDKDSSGLILLTNDGDFAFRMTHPKFVKTKMYLVTLDRALEPIHQQMIADFGVDLNDGKSRLGLTRLDDGRKRWEVVMTEGRNRQIRRTFGALGYTVTRLKRVEFGEFQLGELKPGEYREIKV